VEQLDNIEELEPVNTLGKYLHSGGLIIQLRVYSIVKGN
jgi:hypothetical protein